MKKILVSTAIACLLMVSHSGAQQLKIAFVNSEKILGELPEAQQVQQELQTTVKAWQDELEKMGKELQEGLEDYQKKQALMDPQAKAAKEKSLQDLQQKARDYQYQKFDTREGEAVKLREQKFAPIQQKVMKVIEQVAKEGGYTYIFDKMENATNILYADPRMDLTYNVIDRLKRGTAQKAKDK